MSFIYNILYNNAYPFYDNNVSDACSHIMDINILIDKFIYIDASGMRDSDIDVRCTDIIISPYLAVVSMYYAKNNIIFNITVEKPLSNKIYPIYANGEVAGTIVFRSIPTSQISNMNIKSSDGSIGLRLDNACFRRGVLNLQTMAEPFDIPDNNVNIFVGGSLKASVENTGSNTVITITDNAEVFMSADAIRVPVGPTYGIRAIADVEPDENGNINIEFESSNASARYTLIPSYYTGETLYLDLQRSPSEPRNCISASTYFQDKLRFSGEDGTSTPYPLDSFTRADSSNVCTPNWEDAL